MKRCYVAVLFLCLSATNVSAQSQPAWGTSAESALVIGAFEFQAQDAGTTIGRVALTGDRFANGNLAANFTLPKGALITGVELQGCNTSNFVEMNYWLFRMPTGSSETLLLGIVDANRGCGKFRTNLSHTVDATTGPYMLIWQPTLSNGTHLLTAMRVYYKLQVSPDPMTATFADVPVGHPFHRFVEAIAASGITFGCGNGNYCPDAPITRGQMAVFLSAALGLHWAP